MLGTRSIVGIESHTPCCNNTDNNSVGPAQLPVAPAHARVRPCANISIPSVTALAYCCASWCRRERGPRFPCADCDCRRCTLFRTILLTSGQLPAVFVILCDASALHSRVSVILSRRRRGSVGQCDGNVRRCRWPCGEPRRE